MISPDETIKRLNKLVIDQHDVYVIAHSTCAMVYSSIAAALADRLQIDGEATIVEDEHDEHTFVLVFAPSWAIRAAGLGERAHPVTEIRFRHAADAALFVGNR